MRRLLLAVLLVLAVGAAALWWALTPPSPLVAASTDFSLAGVTVIEPGRRRVAGATLAVRDGVITALAETPGEAPANARADLAGTFVLPGLVDMHAHLPPANALRLSGYATFLYLAYGVTSIRDVGDTDGTSVDAARDGIASRAFPGPRIFSCGPLVAGAMPVRWANTLLVKEPADAERIAARLASEGHMCIKSYEDLTLEKIAALKVAAERHGLLLLGHVPSELGYEEALLPDVQHFLGVPPPASLARDHVLDRAGDWHAVDDARMDEIVRVTLEHGIVNTPTLISTHALLRYRDYEAAHHDPAAELLPRLYVDVAWNPTDGLPFWHGIERYLDRIEDAYAKKRELLRRLHAAGARLQLGTDAQQPFVAPGLGMHQEIGEFAGAGIPLEEVWAMATWRAAETLGVPDLGSLRSGAPADLLVFRADPTHDLAALDTLAAVVAQGKLYTRADLDAGRAAYQAHYRSPLVDTLSIESARVILHRTVLRDY